MVYSELKALYSVLVLLGASLVLYLGLLVVWQGPMASCLADGQKDALLVWYLGLEAYLQGVYLVYYQVVDLVDPVFAQVFDRVLPQVG